MHHHKTLHRLSWLLVVTAWFSVEAAAAGGAIEGKVVFTGKARRNPLIDMGADPNCLQINAGKKVVQEYVSLNEDQSVDDVFVHVTGDVAAGGAAPADALVVDQRGCTYHPRVAGAVTGQVLRIVNSDSTLHNIHTQSDAGNSFNVGQPGAGQKYEHKLRGQEVMLRLKCDVHEWMRGFVGVKSHPYFAVTAGGGAFRIEGVPAGTYTLQAWQEVLGALDQQVVVKDGETVTVEFAYGAPGSGSGSAARLPAMPVRDLAVTAPTKP
ncbi:MAG TPA: TonB-dependent receptor [Thermoanaerobaculia bacterium]|jgi:plastocyanin